jgi:hypothetical protein
VATRSRIDKGLLAIPTTLLDLFPAASGDVFLLNEAGEWDRKHFTAYGSSSRECRIGGMREFYARYAVKDGDEIVLHVLGDERYELIPERLFRREIARLESELDEAPSEPEAGAALAGLERVAHVTSDEAIAGEYTRLVSHEVVRRKVRTGGYVQSRESVPASLRVVLARLYGGRCQVSGFSFVKKDGQPYFELHHIDPLLGHHVKNVLVVSPNVHAQFTYAAVDQTLDDDGWLRQVRFNDEAHLVRQMIDQLPTGYGKRVHSE